MRSAHLNQRQDAVESATRFRADAEPIIVLENEPGAGRLSHFAEAAVSRFDPLFECYAVDLQDG